MIRSVFCFAFSSITQITLIEQEPNMVLEATRTWVSIYRQNSQIENDY